MPIMDNFKGLFPEWATTDWSNVYIEITDVDVTIRSLFQPVDSGRTIALTESDFVSRLLDGIAAAKN